MAYDKNQNEYPVPNRDDNKRTNSSLLPRYFRTDANKKFVESTLDQLTSPGVVEKINGFVGRRESKAVTINDSFIPDVSKDRENYQFEPYTIIEDELGNVTYDADYLDLLGQIKAFGGNVENHDKTFSQEFYAWNPHIDFDKFTNFREYYWLPNGPQEVPIKGQSQDVVSTYMVTLVEDDDNQAFVFSPDGITRNPVLKLFRGQKYRFVIDTPGHPFGIALSRLKKIPYSDSTGYVENLYLDGVNIIEEYNDTVINRSDLVDEGFLEKGVLEFTVPTYAPNNLYYISQNDIDVSGNLNIFDIEDNTSIDVEKEIIGKVYYTTSDGWDLSNGMKVYFQGNVTPEKYAEGLYYVEGVGESIQLVPANNLQVPAIFTQDTQVPFDVNGFDRVPFGDAKSFAGTKDYICINRKDSSRNPWSRYNRWTHRTVIEKSAEINNQPIEIFQELRARRPIIEFEANLRLFNHGNESKQDVDLVDTFTKDVFSTIEGNIGYNVDGVDLVEGMRVLFTADPDTLVNGKIFEVKFIRHNNRTQISLIETEDTLPVQNQTILIRDGAENAGRMYWYNGLEWKLAQDKTGINQSPKFDLFDENSNSIGNSDVYDSTEFTGNRIFNYRIGEGTNDDELGFPLTYKNFVNIGDIVFDFPLLNENYNYKVNGVFENIKSDVLYLQKYQNNTITYENAWKKSNTKSRQYVVRKFTGEDLINNFPIDVYDNSAELNDLIVQVFVNNQFKYENIDYSFVSENKIRKIVFNNDLQFTDIVVVKTYSNANKNTNGYYEIPHNLERNPLNDNVIEFTLGEVNDHVEGIVAEIVSSKQKDFEGAQPGVGNLRDLGILTQFGRKFVQHSGPLNIPMYNLVSKKANVVKSIRYASNEYQKFKRRFIQLATDNTFNGTVKQHVDFIFNLLNEDKTENMNFYSTDMAGTGGSVEIEYEVLDNRLKVYALNNIFSKTAISNKAVYVYINDQQLLHDYDYEFTESGFVEIKKDLNNGDIIKINEYTNTEGSFIPPTPTKIGLYPAFKPEIFYDNTYQTDYDENGEIIDNTGPTNVIRGHDGSIIVAFNDYRDDLILELEKRIYNNLKTIYNTDIFDIHDIVGGYSRNTDVTKQHIDNILISDFVKWLDIAKINDYTQNSYTTSGNTFTYNYSLSTNAKNQTLPGFWRGVYIQAYDTDRPHTHPWEMLGFTSEPIWWQEVYGPAPYTSNNLILWTDLQNGTVREPGKPIKVRSKYVRTDLLNHIPVNENGQLLSPLESGYAKNFNFARQNNLSYKFGDHAPVETAWRRSSDFPFSLVVAMVLLRPAHTMGIGFDRSRIKRDKVGNLVYSNTNRRIRLNEIVFPQDDSNITGGFLNYISNYINTDTEFTYNQYIENIKNIKNKLGFKLAGFANKEKLKLVLDSKTPLNQGNVFVPFENYNIFLRSSSPQTVVTYSGVIIEKTSLGYKINGYDKEQPYFEYNPVQELAKDPFIVVGGISESFINWTENKTLIAGKIVKFNDVYYRVNVNHTTTADFEAEKFTRLSSLPQIGGVGAYFRKKFSSKVSKLNYGTILPQVQDVVDFILGYENQLLNLGFEFNFFNKQTEAIENWKLAAKEFLFWTTQNWATTSILTLSPSANNLQFSNEYYIVDNIFNSFYDYPILNENGQKINNNFFNVFRNKSNTFNLNSNDNGIYMIKLPLIQKEHLVFVDNTTVFNDTLYSPSTGYRQDRLKVVGYRTDDWNGGFNIPGFIYDDAKVEEWVSYKDYKIGELVKFKEFYYSANISHSGTENFNYNFWSQLDKKPQSELLANWEYRTNQFADFYDLDSDNFDSEQQRLAQHLIGYQKRNYLSNIIQDDISQYKFYQGFIQDKGTSNSVTKLFDKLGSANQDSIELYEEWAIRVGQYGATKSFDEVEFKLDEKQFRIEPQLVELVNQIDNSRTDLIYQYPRKDVYIAPANYDDGVLPVYNSVQEYTKTGGYVKLDQINFIAKKQIDILNLDINSVDIGNYIWVPQEGVSWNVYKHVVSKINVTSIEKTDLGFRVYFDKPVDFTEDTIIGINNVNDEVNGFWLTTNIQPNVIRGEDSSKIFPNIEIETDNPISETFIDLSDSTLGVISEFSSRRVSNVEDINNILKTFDIEQNDRFWIDNIGNDISAVYDSNVIRTKLQNITAPEESSTEYGRSVAVSYNNTTMAVGAPDLGNNGKVFVYNRNSEAVDYKLIQTLEPLPQNHDSGDFGASVAVTQNGQYLFVGAPTASNVKSRYKGVLDPLEAYTAGDIVSQKGALWKAVRNVTVESSTINLDSQDWEQVQIITSEPDALAMGYTNQGVIYIYKKLIDNTFELIEIICSSTPATDEKFGYGIKVASPGDFDHNLFVRSFANNGRVYIIKNGGQSDVENFVYNIDTRYRGEWQTISKYIENEIVIYLDKVYQANQTVFPGNPWNPELWNQLDDFIDYTGYIPNSLNNSFYKGTWLNNTFYDVDDIVFFDGNQYRATVSHTSDSSRDESNLNIWTPDNSSYWISTSYSTTDLFNEDSSGFGLATDVGITFDISNNGEVLAVSAILLGAEYRVAIYKKENGRFVFSQSIDSPVDDELFGYSVSLNSNGNKLAIGAPYSSENGNLNGKVYVYKLENQQFVLDQNLFSPADEIASKFGSFVKIDTDKLAVTSRAGKTQYEVTFDNDETSFDNNATNLVDYVINNNQVYIYETIDNKFIYAEKLYSSVDTSNSNSSYGLLNRNHLYVVSPSMPLDEILGDSTNNTGLIQDFRTNLNQNAWTLNDSINPFVNLEKIRGIWLYDNRTKDLISYLDFIDPIQGRIAGPAEQEISYKLYYDPAVYNSGSTNTGIRDLWGKEQVGKLWWNIETIKWYNPYQGDLQFKSNTWNQIIPGFSIDVYEWVESTYLPSEWDSLADTTEGLAEGISGQSLYGDETYVFLNSYDTVSGVAIPKYYYWVKSKTTIPDTYGRKISALDVENLIADPASQGYRFVNLFDQKNFALHNVRNLIKDKDTILHIDYYVNDNVENNIHSEYQLLTEGLASSKPNRDIVDKWIDSLVGYNKQNIQLPDTSISIARRFGILNEPNQSMFVNRKEALKQIIERVNAIMTQYVIVDEFDISPLMQIDPLPSKFSNQWDTEIESESLLRFIGTAKLEQAKLTPVIVDGRIKEVQIVNSGRGYIDSNYSDGAIRNGPTVTIEGTGTGAEIKTFINNLGQITSVEVISSGNNYLDDTTLIVRPFSVLVKNDSDIGGFWAVYNWISSTQEWFRSYIQDYAVPNYWSYKDWYATDYNIDTAIDFIIPGAYALEGTKDVIGSIVKIENIGSGGWLLLEKIDNQENVDYTVNYKTVGRQNGTIEFSSQLYKSDTVGYDKQIYDTSFYDREPTQEIRIILNTIENNIFVDQLEVEWNKLFFSSIRYAISEQVDVDWIFKSSFVTAKHNVGELQQKITYQNDNLPNYQDYINEVKPFSTKIREYVSAYEKIEPTQTSVTDFDLPPSYDSVLGKIVPEAIKFANNQLTNIEDDVYQYPKRHWLDNVGFEIKEFVIFDGGEGYTNTANVTVSGGGGPTLEGFAYLGGSSIQFIDVDTKGARYFNTPQVTINGSLLDDGREAIVYAIVGNNLVRNSHILMKFDRVSGNYLFTTLDETENFIGNGGLTEFNLKWPLSTKTSDVNVIVDGVEQLSSDIVVSNELDKTRDFERYTGRITFVNAPTNNSLIEINYKKSTELLTAADRINFFYNPKTNMPGKDLSQLMDGVDYGGVQMDSIGFGENKGFELQPFGVDFDTFDINNEDEVIVLDGSTQTVVLSKVLESGITYNVYLNNVRIDDPNYPSDGVTNPNAKMVSPVGDGITNTVFLDSNIIRTQADDVVVVRKITSDGSFTPENNSFDVSLQGGNFEYTTATGIDSGDIVVDGDGFVTETTSKGPEEQVPGQVLDTVDIQIYNRSSDGQGAIAVSNYITDGNTLEWAFESYAQTKDTIIVKLDGVIIDNNELNIDWINKTISAADSAVFDADKNLTILTIGTNGVDVIDSDNIIADGNKTFYSLPIKYNSNMSSFVTINGVFKESGTDYGFTFDSDGFITLEFPTKLASGSIIGYTIYDGNVNQYSQMVIDSTMLTDGVNKIHRFTNDVTAPVIKKPLAQNILVKRQLNERFLNPGYRKKYTMTASRTYNIDSWRFKNSNLLDTSDFVIYINSEIVQSQEYIYDNENGRIIFTKEGTGTIGDILEIFVIKDAEYFFLNTTIQILNGDSIDDPVIGSIAEFKLTDDSTVVLTTIESFSRQDDILTLELNGYVRELFELKSKDDTPPVVASLTISDRRDSTQPTLGKIELVETDVLNLAEAPKSWETVDIYVFSNHDINEFERDSYDVVWNTTLAPSGTDEYIDKNLLSKGYIQLQKPAVSANYVWIIKNGRILTPQVDYKISNNKQGIQLYEKVKPADTIDVLQFAAPISKPKFGYRIFKDMLNRYHYKRLNRDNQYELQQPLNYYDQTIQLKDATGIQEPNPDLGIPGVVWIDKERIEYYTVDGNLLRRLRRGTLGTGIKNVYDTNTTLIGQGIDETIPYKDQTSKTIFIGDSSTKQFLLDFVPSSVNEIEVFLGGVRLRKDNVVTFDPTKDQDSPEADVTIAPEFTIETIVWGDSVVTALYLADYIDPPADGTRIEIVRKTGKIWNDTGKTIADSENQIAKFITDKTISLPR